MLRRGDYVVCNFPFREARGPGPSPHLVLCAATGRRGDTGLSRNPATIRGAVRGPIGEFGSIVGRHHRDHRRRVGSRQGPYPTGGFPAAQPGHGPIDEDRAIGQRRRCRAEHGKGLAAAGGTIGLPAQGLDHRPDRRAGIVAIIDDQHPHRGQIRDLDPSACRSDWAARRSIGEFEGEGKSAAHADLACHRQAAAQQRHQPPADREPEPDAAILDGEFDGSRTRIPAEAANRDRDHPPFA
jgi:hypothetical protein